MKEKKKKIKIRWASSTNSLKGFLEDGAGECTIDCIRPESLIFGRGDDSFKTGFEIALRLKTMKTNTRALLI